MGRRVAAVVRQHHGCRDSDLVPLYSPFVCDIAQVRKIEARRIWEPVLLLVDLNRRSGPPEPVLVEVPIHGEMLDMRNRNPALCRR